MDDVVDENNDENVQSYFGFDTASPEFMSKELAQLQESLPKKDLLEIYIQTKREFLGLSKKYVEQVATTATTSREEEHETREVDRREYEVRCFQGG